MEFPQILEWAAAATPATIFAAWLWMERAERVDLQKRYDGLVERQLTAMNAAAQAVAALRDMLQAGARRE